LIGLSVFRSLINKAPHLKGFSWLGAYVYDGFHLAFSTKTLDNIRFNTDIKSGRAITLVQACAYRQIQRFQSDLDTLAQTRSEKDWQALKDAAAAIAGEVLQMLLTPLPGGVTGMNRVMQLAVMGSLTYSAAQGVNELAKGEASGFASALADVTDLAVSGKLISTAGRAHRQRMHAYLENSAIRTKSRAPTAAMGSGKPTPNRMPTTTSAWSTVSRPTRWAFTRSRVTSTPNCARARWTC